MADDISSYECYLIWYNGPSSLYNNKLLVATISISEQGKHGLTRGPAVFSTKTLRLPPEGSMGYIICPPCAISCHFLAIKTPVLWFASYPAVSNCVQIGCGHHVGEQVIVRLHLEGLVLQVLLELLGYGPL